MFNDDENEKNTRDEDESYEVENSMDENKSDKNEESNDEEESDENINWTFNVENQTPGKQIPSKSIPSKKQFGRSDRPPPPPPPCTNEKLSYRGRRAYTSSSCTKLTRPIRIRYTKHGGDIWTT